MALLHHSQALSLLVQPRVLHRDAYLVGDGREQGNLLCVELPSLSANDAKHTYRPPLGPHGSAGIYLLAQDAFRGRRRIRVIRHRRHY